MKVLKKVMKEIMKLKEYDEKGWKRRNIIKLYFLCKNNFKMKVVQFFAAIRTDQSRPARKKKDFFYW